MSVFIISALLLTAGSMTAIASPGNYNLEHLTVFDRPKPKPMPAPGENEWLSPDVDLEEADIYSEHLANLQGWGDQPVPCLHDETEEDRCARTSNTDNIISPDDRMAEASGGESSTENIITPNKASESDPDSEHLADLRPWGDLPMPFPGGPHPTSKSDDDAIMVAETSGGESSADGIITPNMMKPNQTTFKNDQPKAQKVQFWPYNPYVNPYVRYSNACSAGCYTGWTGLAGNPCQCVFWNLFGAYTVWGFYL